MPQLATPSRLLEKRRGIFQYLKTHLPGPCVSSLRWLKHRLYYFRTGVGNGVGFLSYAAQRLLAGKKASAPSAAARSPSSAGVPFKTLCEEIQAVAIQEGGYPDRWLKHHVCPCCRSPKIKPFFEKFSISHWICKGCKFVFVNPYPPEALLQRLYNGSYYTSFRSFVEEPLARTRSGDCPTSIPSEVASWLIEQVRTVKQVGSWLDVGGGIGAFANRVREQLPGFKVYLNEHNEESRRIARELFQLEVLPLSIAELTSQGLSFDVISMIAVLEHISQPRLFLEQLQQLLKPGGLLVLNVPRLSTLCRLFSKGSCANVVPPFHLSLFHERNLLPMLESYGTLSDVKFLVNGPRAFRCEEWVQFGDYSDIAMATAENGAATITVREFSPREAAAYAWLKDWDSRLERMIEAIDGGIYLNIVARRQ